MKYLIPILLILTSCSSTPKPTIDGLCKQEQFHNCPNFCDSSLNDLNPCCVFTEPCVDAPKLPDQQKCEKDYHECKDKNDPCCVNFDTEYVPL